MNSNKSLTLSPIEQKIIDIVKKQEGKPISSRAILDLGKFNNTKYFYSALDFLTKQNKLEKLVSGRYVLAYENGEILYDKKSSGRLIINTKGDGFVKKEDDEKSSFYINKKNLNGAMDGDLVQIALMDKNQTYSDLFDAIIISILERSRDFFVGTYFQETTKDGKKIVKIQPDDLKITHQIILDDDSQLTVGNKVLFKIARIVDDKIYCSVSKIIGHINDVGSDILSVVYDNGIEPEFDPYVLKEVEQIDFQFSSDQDKKRKDLSDLNFVTIDPATSKDMDDAICVIQKEDYFKLYVAIADVSYYVKLGTKLWDSTIKRGTSIYLVNQVVPMLPHKLSNNICSLNPFEKRYAMVCEMDINYDATYRKIDVYPAIIKSKKKFAYENINEYFANGFKLLDVGSEIYEMIDSARQLHRILDERHKKDGYIDFEIPEPLIILDDFGKIKDIQVKKTGEAQKMIENFMVAANEAVTIRFEQLKPNLPFVYRVHNSPEETRITAFKTEAKKLGFKYDSTLTKWKPDTVSNWLKNNKNFEHKELINMLLLRTMAKAKYDSTNVGHFGLSLKKYTHFTSPIRRLADVVVHHLYRAFVFDTESYSDEQRSYLISQLDQLNNQANETEKKAVTTERDVNSLKFAEFMETKIGFKYEGFASYIVNFGVFVLLNNMIEGCIKPMGFKDDFYTFNPDDFTFIGKKNKRIITLGQKMKIKVIGANKATKKIDFECVKFIDKK